MPGEPTEDEIDGGDPESLESRGGGEADKTHPSAPDVKSVLADVERAVPPAPDP